LTILTAKSLLIKISKILKYSPGIYKQFLFSSTNSILCSIYGTVQDCKDISPIQIPLHCPAGSTSSVLFYEYDGTVPNCWYLRNSSLRCYAKASSRFLSRETPCWRSYPRTNL